MDYAYPCILTPDEDERGSSFVVSFPDVPEAITGARTREESLLLAEDALVVALSMYVDADEDVPTPSAPAGGQELIILPPHTAAQLALYTALRRQNKSISDLARSLGIRESKARRLLNFSRPSPLDHVLTALRALDRTLVVRDGAESGRTPARAATG
ncbi:MAG: type II toxin-antitoxin system HicB family antitoxin [Acidobacteria bacterium]|nr:type II toxin-antitoxin system HicB family antitoxin [Acidobacteriota bacterium]